MTGYSRGPAQAPTKPFRAVLDGLITQRRLCGAEKCNRPKCRRCGRAHAFRRKEGIK